MINKNAVKNLTKSFLYAFSGIVYCIKNERNMRIHLCMVVLVSVFSYYYKVSSGEFVILALCMGAVVTNEMINTAIETLTNLESPSYNSLARIAKDVAAGAVFVSAIVAVVVGGMIFLRVERLKNALILIFTNPFNILLFAAIIIISVLFIFNGSQLVGEPKTKVWHMKNYDDKSKGG